MLSYEEVVERAFLDELQKIAASKQQMTVSQTRQGRRPMSVSTMLEKHKDGSLFKKGYSPGSTNTLGGGTQPYLAEGVAPEVRKAGDAPSRDGATVGLKPKREDGHDMTATVPAGGAIYSSETGPGVRQ